MVVVIYTNENNPNTLKLLISAQHAGKTVEIKPPNPNGQALPEPKYFPCMQTEENQYIFIPNVASRFFYASTDDLNCVDEWLEWESAILAPTASHILGTSTKNDKLKKVLVSCLKKLDCSLQNKQFLTGDKINLCDIVIFSTVYALHLDKNLGQEYLSELPKLLAWIKLVESIEQVQNALKQYSLTGGYQSYNSMFIGSRYVLPSALLTESNVQHSPIHGIETITPEELSLVKKAWNKNISDAPKPKQQNGIILPESREKNILVTSALPYVNNVPHLGNIIGCVLSADVFARFCRLCNYNTLLICGTDEYGTATETKALEEKLTCREICDKYYAIHNEIYKWFNISFDHFGRTSTPQQTELCQEMFLRLNENGFMFTQPVDQLHCENCNRYLADRFVEGGCPHIGCNYEDARGDQCDGCGKLVNAVELKNPRCKICGQTPKLKTSKQFFIDLPKLEPLLLHWMKLSSPGWSNNAQVIARAWLKEGLKPRCITRDLKWGVPVPLEGYTNKVFYVWFDAPLGYMSITKAYTKEWERWWRPPPGIEVKLYQFMAKDNVPFHAVMFPATLLGANRGYTTVSHLMATEYLNYEDGKFSKSRGVGVFGNDARSTGISSDVWRFYLLYVRPESQDSSFSWSDLATKNNSELLNNLGNFINRALVFAKNNFNRTVPIMKPSDEDFQFLTLCTREFKDYVSSLEKAKLRDGIRHILAISRHGNQYMQVMQPWVLLKGGDNDKERAGTVIGLCCNIAALLAVLLHPYMPDTSATLKKQLNLCDTVITPSSPEIITLLPAGHKLGEPAPLFTKIEPARVEELKKQFAGKQAENGTISTLPLDLKSLEAAVAKQADKVRELKATSKDKNVWQPEVNILLDLKKKLEQFKADNKTDKPKQNGALPEQNGVASVDPVLAKKLEAEVEQQAAHVRKLKESGANKTVWQPEVEKLLQLKGKLAEATGQPVTTQQKGKKSKK